MQTEAMVYSVEDLEPVEVPIKLGNKELVLVQATPAVVNRYESMKLSGADIQEDGKVRLKEDPDRLHRNKMVIVAACLREVYEVKDDGGKPVKMHRPLAQAWIEDNVPHWVLDDLFTKAQQISRIDTDWSVEGLEKHIASCQERLARMKAPQSKNSEGATAGPSA